MIDLNRAVKLTLRYADFFHGHLSDKDLHRWLISDKTCSAKVLKKLFPQVTKSRADYSVGKLNLAKRVAKLISFVPTVSFVAATGSLAVNNAKLEDDIDLMIVTRQDTLWLTRPIVTLLVSLFFKRRTPKVSNILAKPDLALPDKSKISNTICLNLWLDESALAVPEGKRSLYTAHEVLQAKPIFDRRDVYVKFILTNQWTKKYLANAYTAISKPLPLRRGDKEGFLFRIFHYPCLPAGRALSILNYLAFRLQYHYMKRKITRETVTLHTAYFHPRDFSGDLDTFLKV